MYSNVMVGDGDVDIYAGVDNIVQKKMRDINNGHGVMDVGKIDTTEANHESIGDQCSTNNSWQLQ